MIQLQNVSKQFKTSTIFQNVNMELFPGDRIFIRGVNGSGKSVLLKLIVGFSTPTEGEILIDGQLLGKTFDFLPNTGLSINAPEFMKNWTGLENLLYLAEIKKQATEADILQLATELSLTGDLHKKYKTYSLGMRQKMRLIQALMDQPQYLVLDEPFDALDKTSRAKVFALLETYLSTNPDSMLVYTSHSVNMEEFATRVFEIDDYQVNEVLSL